MTLIPVLVSTGRMPSGLVIGRSVKPNILGMLGPVMSASSTPTRMPCRRSATASMRGHRRLAHAAFAAHHGHHVRDVVQPLGQRLFVLALLAEQLLLVLLAHLDQVDREFELIVQLGDLGLGLFDHLPAQRASQRGQGKGKADLVAHHGHVAHHAQFDDIAPQFGVHHIAAMQP